MTFSRLLVGKGRQISSILISFSVPCSFLQADLGSDEAKSAGILCVFRAFLTIYEFKYAEENLVSSDDYVAYNKTEHAVQMYGMFLRSYI
jgi:hypothetical protein